MISHAFDAKDNLDINIKFDTVDEILHLEALSKNRLKFMQRDILSNMTAVLTYLIAFVVLISVITIIHESGHFFAARICRVKVLDFSIGMGPSILQKQDKHQTNYNIRILPIGGFVQMLGEVRAPLKKIPFNQNHIIRDYS